ncbi:Enoyl coenzyme A hydratase [Mycobacterium marinum MB2]|nr:Enoyl coenzyme A hydratase [Mycobacterium marinum MB2]
MSVPSCPSSNSTAIPLSLSRRPWPPGTFRMCITIVTRRRQRDRRISSSTSSPTPAWCSAM